MHSERKKNYEEFLFLVLMFEGNGFALSKFFIQNVNDHFVCALAPMTEKTENLN